MFKFNSNPFIKSTSKLQNFKIRPFKSKYHFKLQDLNSQNPKFTNQIHNPNRIQNSNSEFQISTHHPTNTPRMFKFNSKPFIKSTSKLQNSTIQIQISLQTSGLELPKSEIHKSNQQSHSNPKFKFWISNFNSPSIQTNTPNSTPF